MRAVIKVLDAVKIIDIEGNVDEIVEFYNKMNRPVKPTFKSGTPKDTIREKSMSEVAEGLRREKKYQSVARGETLDGNILMGEPYAHTTGKPIERTNY